MCSSSKKSSPPAPAPAPMMNPNNVADNSNTGGATQRQRAISSTQQQNTASFGSELGTGSATTGTGA